MEKIEKTEKNTEDSTEDNIKGRKLYLDPIDIDRLVSLCGSNNENLKYMGEQLKVDIDYRGNFFQINGRGKQPEKTAKLLMKLYEETSNGKSISTHDVHLGICADKDDEGYISINGAEGSNESAEGSSTEGSDIDAQKYINSVINTPRMKITPKGRNQAGYLADMKKNTVQFAVGSAGTGKTFLAVAYAVSMLKQGLIEKICLTRPAVEAGETLGFLPGTLIEKINPYLQPVYDALHATLGYDTTNELIKNNSIEISALAYMRGRTLNNCVTILDEAQNTSKEQMKMFLTRMGHNSKTIITGDLTQIDLPPRVDSGLVHAIDILEGIEGIGITRLGPKDVMRHPIVTKIINSYDSKTES